MQKPKDKSILLRRVPAHLHFRIKMQAHIEGKTMEQYILEAAAKALQGKLESK